MRPIDFSPLYRNTVGFDRLAGMLDNVLSSEIPQASYPPYNIEKTGEDAYRITVAVAGFSDDELTVEAEEGLLTISGRKADATDEGPSFLHRGIGTRAFDRKFQLADHVRATGALIENGLLHVDLVREVPEALKPRLIAIDGPKKAPKKVAKAA